MKKNVLLLLFFLTPFYLFSQNENNNIIYYDADYMRVSKEEHVYYRVVKDFDKTLAYYTVEIFYKSGQLLKTGVSRNKTSFEYNGFVTFFYENGAKEKQILYKDGLPFRTYESWYSNGQQKARGWYVVNTASEDKSKILRIDQYWDENNVEKVTKGEGLYFEESGKLSLTGTLKDGLKDGIWIGKDDGFQLSFTENYENGMLISGVSKDANGIERNYTQLEERPTVKRGIHHFYKFVAENFKIKNNIPLKGNLLVTFTITEDGSLSNIHIFKGIHFLIDKEAIRVLQSYPSWNPGKYRGVNTRAQHNLPIAISGN